MALQWNGLDDLGEVLLIAFCLQRLHGVVKEQKKEAEIEADFLKSFF